MVQITAPSPIALPQTAAGTIPAHTPADYPAIGQLVQEFDIWQAGYGNYVVFVFRAGTRELCPLFSDIGLTTSVTNPQTLSCMQDENDTHYGKFRTSVYTPYPYYLEIDNNHQTGVRYPALTDLAGLDASYSTVKAAGASVARPLRLLAAETIFVENYGEIGESADTNTTTIAAAIAAASVNGGGRVYLPAGTIPITTLTIPQGVYLTGAGKLSTTLTSNTADEVITFSGGYSALQDLTLDGVNLNTGSIGIYSENKSNINLINVKVKRFETAMHHKGGTNHSYIDLDIDDITYGAKCYGEGAAFTHMRWIGGGITVATGFGLDLSVVDFPVQHNFIGQADFIDNTAVDGAVIVYGAEDTHFNMCLWDDNTKNLALADNPDTSLTNREVIGLYILGGSFTGGTNTFDGLCQDVTFRQVTLDGVTSEMNIPVNNILFEDCVEYDATITGDGTKFARRRNANRVSIKGDTDNGTVTTVYRVPVNPNEVVLLDVHATGHQTNGTDYAAFYSTHAFRCAPATLNYDSQTANFTVGDTITGGTSGAIAYIVADSDSGSTGVLSIGGIAGTFIDNEIITGATSGSARVNGSLTLGDVSAIGSAVAHVSKGSNAGSPPSGWALGFAVSEQEIQVTVTGAASKDVVWNVDVDVTVL